MDPTIYKKEARKPISSQFDYETVVLLDSIARRHQLSRNATLKYCVHVIAEQEKIHSEEDVT